MPTELTFNSVSLSPISRDNQLWIRATELARALGYSSEKSISNIFKRNQEEFTNEMSVVINLMTTEGATRIFSLRGCHLLAMFSRTPVAKEFRRWVLDVLDRFNAEHAPAPTPAPAHEAAMDATPITADQQCILQQLVKNRIEALPEAQRTGKGLFPQVWSRFNNHFRIARYAQLPQSRMSEAIDYLMRMELTPAIAARGMKDPSREEVQQRKADIDVRLNTLIDDTHRVLREVYFTPDARIFAVDPGMATFHRDIFLLAENFMRSAQDALRMSLKMSQY